MCDRFLTPNGPIKINMQTDCVRRHTWKPNLRFILADNWSEWQRFPFILSCAENHINRWEVIKFWRMISSVDLHDLVELFILRLVFASVFLLRSIFQCRYKPNRKMKSSRVVACVQHRMVSHAHARNWISAHIIQQPSKLSICGGFQIFIFFLFGGMCELCVRSNECEKKKLNMTASWTWWSRFLIGT